ncbi:MAG: hypothetical protein Q7O66_03580 [Dehalococcoidia bacterium]|nr:hypothetical protein [Dehalococcoidia bacterium]
MTTLAREAIRAVLSEEMARRQALVAQIVTRRRERLISPLTTADLVRQVREERAGASDD